MCILFQRLNVKAAGRCMLQQLRLARFHLSLSFFDDLFDVDLARLRHAMTAMRAAFAGDVDGDDLLMPEAVYERDDLAAGRGIE
jgi:hypothetical protein